MKKKLVITFFTVFLFVLAMMTILTNSNTNKPSNAAATTYTREELQDYLVSTVVSYYYNNKYTDYDGFWADESHSEYSTIYRFSPEMISRSRSMYTQCEAFATTCYMYSLGFDFSKFKGSLANGKYTSYLNSSGERLYASQSSEVYKNAYTYFNKVYSVEYMNKIAKDNPNNPMVILTYQKGKISTIEGVTNTSKTVTELLTGSGGEAILNSIISSLQPGDIILNDGHAMVWVGDIFESSGGVIHSTSTSLKMKRDADGNITEYKNGYDAFDVRYSSLDYLIRRGIVYHNSNPNDVITILRPINAMCTFKNDVCTLDSNYASVVDNAIARTKLNRLRIEQFVYDKTGDRTLGTAASVNENDELNYYIYLTNKSRFSFCSSGAKTNESDCTSTGLCTNSTYTTKEDCEKNKYTWTNNRWISIKKDKDYKNITITSTIPSNTEFVKCTKSCKYANGVVTWSNVSVPASSTSENKYGFTVKVLEGTSSVEFKGMNVTYDGSKLQMGSYNTLVNSSINGKYATEFKNIIAKDISNNKKCTSSNSYILDTYSNYLNVENDKAKPVYTTINTELSKIITPDNIVNGIFKEVNFENTQSYTKKTSSEVSKLSGNYKIINQMLVPGFYGGYRYNKLFYTGNMDYYNKVKPTWISRINLNVGDIIVTLKKSGNSFALKNMMVYDGMDSDVPTYVYCENNKVIRHRIRDLSSSDPRSAFYTKWYANNLLLYELFSSDLYVVLRPSMYYNLQYRVEEQTPVVTEPTTPTEPTQPTQPTEPDKPTTPTTPVEPATPTTPTNPTKPTNPKQDDEPKITDSTDKGEEEIPTSEPAKIDPAKEGKKQINLEKDSETTGTDKVYYEENKGWYNDKNETITKIEVPKKEGYVFDGYYVENDNESIMVIDSEGTIVENNEPIEDNTTLYSHWNKLEDSTDKVDNKKNKKISNYWYLIVAAILLVVLIIIIIIRFRNKNKESGS